MSDTHSHSAHSAGHPDVTPSEQQSVRIPLRGMTCASCVRAIEGTLRSQTGVNEANVNFATSSASVRFDPQSTGVDQLRKAVSAIGYEALAPLDHTDHAMMDHAEHARALDDAERQKLWLRLIVSAALSLPVGVFSMAHLIPGAGHALMFPGRLWLELALTSIVLFWGGSSIHSAAFKALRHRRADMNTLITLGTFSAYIYSVVATIWPAAFARAGAEPQVYYEVAALVIVLILLGRYLEERAKGQAGAALRLLLDLQPRTARVLRKDSELDIPQSDLVMGDIVVVRPGERIATDGKVVKGESSIDESMLTGESMPVDKLPGDAVFAGTLNGTGSLQFSATRLGSETVLQAIVRLVEDAQGSKAPIQRLADVVASYFVPVVIAIALVTFALWYFTSAPDVRLAHALIAAVAVLVIACPCALGLATPVAIMVASGRGSERGILIRGAAVLETAARIDTIILDKTGTITQGRPKLLNTVAMDGFSEQEVMSVAAAAEHLSEHPLGKAIVAAANESQVLGVTATEFSSVTGSGIEAVVDGRLVRVGKASYVAADTAVLEASAEPLLALGRTVLYVSVDGHPAGVLGLADAIKPTSKEAIQQLSALGMKVIMLTGDNEQVARAVAADVALTEFRAGLLPADKLEHIRQLQSRGRKVAMVGDGINDAPALAQADLGIAMSAGTDVAMEAADFTLLHNDLRDVSAALTLARRTMLVIKQNLFFAFIYNVIGIPIAAGVLYPFTGWLRSPVIAGAAKALSSLSVVANSLRLRKA
ncbi:MAG: heavy metal translocating P-type ATPase [bacterium]|nr:heavy metal translocating P-type ATPase [bacterium]